METTSLSLSARIDLLRRLDTTSESYQRSLASATLTKAERREIEAIYDRLDAERAAVGRGPAERAPWTAADILEWKGMPPRSIWKGLTAHGRYLDLKTYADPCDRLAETTALRLAA